MRQSPRLVPSNRTTAIGYLLVFLLVADIVNAVIYVVAAPPGQYFWRTAAIVATLIVAPVYLLSDRLDRR